MTRLDNWQTNLSELLKSRMAEPFHIERFNCLMWGFEAVQAVTGVDHYAPFRGKFKTAKGAAKVLRQVGQAETSVELLERLFGEKKPLAFARRGDIVAADVATLGLSLPSDVELFGPAIGVAYGLNSYFLGENGLVPVETLKLGPESYGFCC